MKSFKDFLVENKAKIMKTIRTNLRYEERGYSEYSTWNTLVDWDEEEVVDYDLLIQQIEKFEQSFKEAK